MIIMIINHYYDYYVINQIGARLHVPVFLQLLAHALWQRLSKECHLQGTHRETEAVRGSARQ